MNLIALCEARRRLECVACPAILITEQRQLVGFKVKKTMICNPRSPSSVPVTTKVTLHLPADEHDHSVGRLSLRRLLSHHCV